MDKGPEASCLVAYAIQFGDVANKHDFQIKGSQRLAVKLKNEQFLQQILRVRGEGRNSETLDLQFPLPKSSCIERQSCSN